MKNLTLDFGPRLRLTNLLANASGSLGKLAPLAKVFNKIQFTPGEMKQIKVVDLGGGKQSFTPPEDPKFGHVKVQLEDAWAAALLQEIDESHGWQIADVEWLSAVRESLTAKEKLCAL